MGHFRLHVPVALESTLLYRSKFLFIFFFAATILTQATCSASMLPGDYVSVTSSRDSNSAKFYLARIERLRPLTIVPLDEHFAPGVPKQLRADQKIVRVARSVSTNRRPYFIFQSIHNHGQTFQSVQIAQALFIRMEDKAPLYALTSSPIHYLLPIIQGPRIDSGGSSAQLLDIRAMIEWVKTNVVDTHVLISALVSDSVLRALEQMPDPLAQKLNLALRAIQSLEVGPKARWYGQSPEATQIRAQLAKALGNLLLSANAQTQPQSQVDSRHGSCRSAWSHLRSFSGTNAK